MQYEGGLAFTSKYVKTENLSLKVQPNESCGHSLPRAPKVAWRVLRAFGAKQVESIRARETEIALSKCKSEQIPTVLTTPK